MLPPHVPENVTLPLVELTGVTMYFTLPQPVAGVEADTDDQVPANASMLTVVGDGDVGSDEDDGSLFFNLSRRLHPPARAHASTSAAKHETVRIRPPEQGSLDRPIG